MAVGTDHEIDPFAANQIQSLVVAKIGQSQHMERHRQDVPFTRRAVRQIGEIKWSGIAQQERHKKAKIVLALRLVHRADYRWADRLFELHSYLV